MTMNRRGLLTGLGATIIAAPAIVRISSLMPVKVLRTSYQDLDFVSLNYFAHRHRMMELWMSVEYQRSIINALMAASIAAPLKHPFHSQLVTS